MARIAIVHVVLLLTLSSTFGQSSVDPADKYAWSENIGWTNWRDAGTPGGATGALVHASFLSGLVWAENAGWLNLGAGSPFNGIHYANATDADFGVNLDPDTGELFGLAWGENVGWINFDGGALASPANPARLVVAGQTCRLAGFAWGENVGWVNLDDATHFVAVPDACGTACALAADLDGDGDVDQADLGILLAAFGSCPGDANYAAAAGTIDSAGAPGGDPCVNQADLGVLLAEFGLTCF
jgi:hypothetical protein